MTPTTTTTTAAVNDKGEEAVKETETAATFEAPPPHDEKKPALEESSTNNTASQAVAAAAVVATTSGDGLLPAALALPQQVSALDDTNNNSDNENKKRKAEDTTASPNAAADADAAGSVTKRARAAPTRVPWEDRVAALTAYKAEHGHLNIPIRYKANPSMGKFVHNMREQYKLFHNKCKPGYQKRCSLTAERIAELDAIGFLWTTERVKRQNEDWESRLEQLKEYKAKHGDCLVPHGYDIDPSFAEWIHRQRTTYAAMIKEKKPNQMVIDRMAKLKDMDFNFTVHSDKWTEHWLLLKEYKEKHGNCQVPTHYAENPKLGRWTHTQRHQRRLQIKGKKSCMTKERIELLDQLGFSWEVRPAMVQPRATWQQRYDELKDFYQTYNHFVIPADTHPSLHLWSHEQKARLRNLDVSGKVSSPRMGPDRIAALEELGFTKDTPLADLDLQQIDTDETESLEVDEPQQPVVVAAQVAVEGAAADDHEAATLLAVNDAVESVVNEGMDASATIEPIDTTNFAAQSV